LDKVKDDEYPKEQEKIDWILLGLFFALCGVIGYAMMRFF